MPDTSKVAHKTLRILTRLKLESLLIFHGFQTRVEQGTIWIGAKYARIPVLFRETGAGTRVELRIRYGTCSSVEPDFLLYIAELNQRDDGVRLIVGDDGGVEFHWQHEFPEEIDCETIVQGIVSLGATSDESDDELRERFFVRPRFSDSLREGGQR